MNECSRRQETRAKLLDELGDGQIEMETRWERVREEEMFREEERSEDEASFIVGEGRSKQRDI